MVCGDGHTSGTCSALLPASSTYAREIWAYVLQDEYVTYYVAYNMCHAW